MALPAPPAREQDQAKCRGVGTSPPQQAAAPSQWQPGKQWIHTPAPPPHCSHCSQQVRLPAVACAVTGTVLSSSVASPLPTVSLVVALDSHPCHRVCFWRKPGQTTRSSLKRDHWGCSSERGCNGSPGTWWLSSGLAPSTQHPSCPGLGLLTHLNASPTSSQH